MANVQKIVVKTSGAEKSAGSIKKVDKSIAGLTSSALKYTIAAGAIVGIIKKSIQAYGVQEQAEKKLSTALGRTSSALLKQAAALQQVSVFGDEVIIGVQASIAAFTNNEEAIKRATAATLDMAAATGMDLKAAGDLIAKTLGSSTNALSRYGIVVEGAVGSSERLDTLTKNIADKFGGQAAAAADTMAGKMTQASNAIGDAGEALGSVFIEPVTLAAQGIKLLAEGLQSFINSVSAVDLGVLSLAERMILIDKTVKEHAELSIPELEAAYTAIGNSYDQTATRGSNFLRLLDEQTEAAKALRPEMEILGEDVDSLDGEYIKLNDSMGKTLATFKDLAPLTKKTTDATTDLQKANLEAGLTALVMSDNLGQASRALANQYVVEGVFGAVKTALASFPPGINILAAGAAGIAANALFNSIVPAKAAATGADFVTNGPELLLVGDNPGGRESVQVTPMGSPNINGPQGGVTINISGDFIGTDDFVETKLIPSINRAVNQGRANLA